MARSVHRGEDEESSAAPVAPGRARRGDIMGARGGLLRRACPVARRCRMAIDTLSVVAPPKEAIPLPESSAPLRLTGWDHIAFSVPNLVEAERWYVDVLGAEVITRRAWGGSDDPMRPHVDIRIGSQVVSLFLGEANGSANTP